MRARSRWNLSRVGPVMASESMSSGSSDRVKGLSVSVYAAPFRVGDQPKRSHFGFECCPDRVMEPYAATFTAVFKTGGASFPQQRLCFLPELQGQNALRGVDFGLSDAVSAGLQN